MSHSKEWERCMENSWENSDADFGAVLEGCKLLMPPPCNLLYVRQLQQTVMDFLGPQSI